MAIRNGLKYKTTACGGLELLQMVSELVIEQCTNEDAGPQGGEWIVRSHISLREDQTFLHLCYTRLLIHGPGFLFITRSLHPSLVACSLACE